MKKALPERTIHIVAQGQKSNVTRMGDQGVGQCNNWWGFMDLIQVQPLYGLWRFGDV